MPSKIHRELSLCAALCLGALLLATSLVPAPARADDDVLFTLVDPRGDDHGDGSLIYPGRSEFEHGDLDLIELTARPDSRGTLFEATFAQRIKVPKRIAMDSTGVSLTEVARHGFYTFNIDIYIDVDRTPGSGAVRTLPGRKAEVAPNFAWERAISLTPRPHAARGELKRMVLQQLNEELMSSDTSLQPDAIERMKVMVPEEMARRVFFPTRVRVLGNKIRFYVPTDFLGGVAQPEWGYVVVVTGSDLLQTVDLTSLVGRDTDQASLMVLPRETGQPQDVFGGARENDPLQTPIVDMVVPAGERQERLLQDYDVRTKRPVQLIGVVPAEKGGRNPMPPESPQSEPTRR